MTATRVRATFAGTEFSGFERRTGTVTVPVNVVRKMLLSGRVRAMCDMHATDDYAADNDRNYGRGPATAEAVLDALAGHQPGWKPWLCYLNTATNEVRLCPYQSLCYTLTAA